MIDSKKLAYDICRLYVQDNSSSTNPPLNVYESDKILGWIRSRNVKRLSTVCEYFPGVYSSQERCLFFRQVAAFFKKNAAFSESTSLRRAAFESFMESEVKCSETNARLAKFAELPWLHDVVYDGFAEVVEKACDICHDVLGDFQTFLGSLPDLVKFTNGATSAKARRYSQAYRKVSLKPHCTRRAQPYLKALALFYGHSGAFRPRVGPSNRVTTVPKNYKTDRTIACEPEGNLVLQLAFDSYAKERLREHGVDLSDQRANQRLAKESSRNGWYATLDLSAASDSVSLNASRYLLPKEWWKYLEDIRSPMGSWKEFLGNESHIYSKISSMGNGATFCLETLIFYALCRAVVGCDGRVLVYGDDLIVPVEHVNRVCQTLHFFGFSVNQEKSFTDGLFRESCGRDWFDGKDVTPFYIRSQNTMQIEYCHLVNGLASRALPQGLLAEFLRDLVEAYSLPLVPFNYSTIAGVWVDPYTAHREKLVRMNLTNSTDNDVSPWVPYFFGYEVKDRVRVVADSRTLFLWHLDAARGRESESSRDSFYKYRFSDACAYNHDKLWPKAVNQRVALVRSRVADATHRYRVAPVRWVVPHTGIPCHLDWWSDYVYHVES